VKSAYATPLSVKAASRSRRVRVAGECVVNAEREEEREREREREREM
jgi:hypothetical protein